VERVVKLSAEQLASLDWKAVDAAADAIKRSCHDIVYVAPDNTAIQLLHIRRVAEQLTAIAAALNITPPGGSS
jgi:hypothetical protein